VFDDARSTRHESREGIMRGISGAEIEDVPRCPSGFPAPAAQLVVAAPGRQNLRRCAQYF